MRTLANEIKVYYNPEHNTAKQVLAYARSIVPHINEVEYTRTKLSTTLWRQILDMLGSPDPKSLLNKAHPYYQKNLRGKEFNREDILNIIIRNPEIIRAPIAIRGKVAVFCDQPVD
ncbi:MAG: arsenate reductase family protein, partial [Chitinophagales bacterium]